MSFPKLRMRRLRRTEVLRSLVRQTRLSPESFIYPVFIEEGLSQPRPVASMPGVSRLPLNMVVKEMEEAYALGLKALMLFGIPSVKDEVGSTAYSRGGVVQRAVRDIRAAFGDRVGVMTDLCLCQYTSHGHCGVVKGGELVNDETLTLLGKVAVSQAEAGADIVAPSGMIDGQVKAVREALDDAGYSKTAVMAYSAKFASSFYSPFREAVDSAPKSGDRRGYQMAYSNPDEALREIGLDLEEGADIVMVKPALAYLDIIYRAKAAFRVPLAAYSVSGEYSLMKAAVEKGWLAEEDLVLEVLTAIKRAGADLILTYHAKDAARWVREAA